ncbi:MAG: hypothetical protein ACK5HB_07265, partial [Ignavibacteria bacterium]
MLHIACLCIASSLCAIGDDIDEAMRKSVPPQLKFLRVYGGDDESMPPIALTSRPTNLRRPNIPFNFSHVTIELD